MVTPAIICVDDQEDVLAAVRRDLQSFADALQVVTASSADEAWELAEDLDAAGYPVAVVVTDQVMPGGSGVDLLKRLRADGRFAAARMCLLTGQATHADTIEAINVAQVGHYIEKPWAGEQLANAVSSLFTQWLLEESGEDHLPFMSLIDQDLLRDHLHRLG